MANLNRIHRLAKKLLKALKENSDIQNSPGMAAYAKLQAQLKAIVPQNKD